MAENFIKQPFGLNIKVPTRTIKQSQETAQGVVSSLWEPLFNFIDQNQNVFTGNVANEIEKYNLMMFNVGAALRQGNTNGSFDVKG